MSWVALIAWLLTAGFGFTMLVIWLSRGGMRPQPGSESRIRPPLILGHFLLAATGLVLWIVYVATDSDALAWIAFVILLAVALLGWTMFGITRRSHEPLGDVIAHSANPGAPEDHFPKVVIGLHGLLAVTTVVLVFLAAVGVGS
jgi:manganese efflux pump family protein